VDATWTLGFKERNSRKCILIPAPGRSANTLIPLIEQYVLPGSTVITDGGSSYSRLRNTEFFTHLTANHSLNFLNPDDPLVHSQNIENSWLHAKRNLRKQFGTTPGFLEGYLYEFCFKSSVEKTKVLNNLITSILENIFLFDE